jgi:hypothetical protein
MSDQPKDMSDTGRMAAVREELHEVSGIVLGLAKLSAAEHRAREEERQYIHTGLTPAPVPAAESTDKLIRGIAREVVLDEIRGHKLTCMEPGGGLRELGNKVEKVDGKVDEILIALSDRKGANRVWKLMGAGAWAVGLLVLGFALNHFAARRQSEAIKANGDAVKAQVDAADKMAKTLKEFQDIAKGIHGSLESPEPPKCQFATVAP